jgi:hypothetical protein
VHPADCVERREIGSGRDRQIERTLARARALAATPAQVVEVVGTDGRALEAVAARVIDIVGW